MTVPQRHPGNHALKGIFGSQVLAIALSAYGVMQLGRKLHTGEWLPINPGDWLKLREWEWTGWHTTAAVVLSVLFVGQMVAVGKLYRRAQQKREHVDAKAPLLGKGTEMTLKAIRTKNASAKYTQGDNVGLRLGRAVATKQEMWVDWRSTVLAVMNPGAGKALALDTKIPTPQGWTTMGALRAGNEVFDEHGQPAAVLMATQPMENHRCYEVAFSSGETIVADAEHLWVTRTSRDKQDARRKAGRRPEPGRHRGRPVHMPEQTVTTEVMAQTLMASGKLNHSIRVCDPVQYPKKDLPIQPYTLGAWLGDGTSSNSQITNHPQDAQILAEIRADGYDVLPMTHPSTHRIGTDSQRQRLLDLAAAAIVAGASRYAAARHFGVPPRAQKSGKRLLSGVWTRGRRYLPPVGSAHPRYVNLCTQLRRLGVLNNKHIPADYLQGSVEQRLALLQGLMDTDGAISASSGGCVFAVTNRRLAEGALELILSLGVRAKLSESVAKLDGRIIGPQYKIHFRPTMPVFRLRRKLERIKPLSALQDERAGFRYITSIREVKSVPVCCIKVSNPSGLFLAGESFIATHNTSCLAIPWILKAPGWVYATANKPDLYLAIREGRERQGRFWCFDPQRVADASPNMVWNPLTYIYGPGKDCAADADTKAVIQANLFADAARVMDAKTDGFFEPEGINLLAGLLLAAAADKRPITDVVHWINNPNQGAIPIGILRRHGWTLSAGNLDFGFNLNDETKRGVFANAKKVINFLFNRDALQWIVKDPAGDMRPEFDPHQFVRSGGDTLISLSKEGVGSLGPLVAALTVAVTEAAQEYAKTCPGGRIDPTGVMILDEAANVARIKMLPDWFSHFASQGIFILVILQSIAQGRSAWGKDGIDKMSGASTHRVYGRGIDEMDLLEKLSKLCGPYDERTWSTGSGAPSGIFATGHATKSTNMQFHRVPILEPADIAALPDWRVLVQYGGGRPVLGELLPYFTDKEMNEAVRRSIDAYGPRVLVTV